VAQWAQAAHDPADLYVRDPSHQPPALHDRQPMRGTKQAVMSPQPPRASGDPQRLCSPVSAAPRPATPPSRHQAEHRLQRCVHCAALVRAAPSTHRIAGHRAHPCLALLAPAAAKGGRASQAGTAKAAALRQHSSPRAAACQTSGTSSLTAHVLSMPDSEGDTTPHVQLHRKASTGRPQAHPASSAASLEHPFFRA
jgi:hypothetical protein